jgi:hypothetical protein
LIRFDYVVAIHLRHKRFLIMRKIDLRFYLNLMIPHRWTTHWGGIYLHQILFLIALIFFNQQASAQDPAQILEKPIPIGELYYSTFVNSCQEYQQSPTSQTQLLTYSALYFGELIEDIKNPKLWIETLNQEVKLQAIDENESHLWLIAVDSTSYQNAKQKEELKKQIELIKKQLQPKDLMLLMILDFNHPKQYQQLMPKYVNQVDVNLFFSYLDAANAQAKQYGVSQTNLYKIMEHIYGLKNQIEIWGGILQNTRYVYVNHCNHVTAFHPKVRFLIFTNLNTTLQPEPTASTKNKEEIDGLKKEFESALRSPRSPIFGMHILPISNQKLISEPDHLKNIIKDNRILQLKHKLYLNMPSETDLVSEIAHIQEIDQQIKLIELFSVDSQYWRGDDLKLKVRLKTASQIFEGLITVDIKQHQSKLQKVLDQKSQDLIPIQSPSTQPRNHQDLQIDTIEIEDSQTQTDQIYLSKKMIYMLGLSLIVLFVLFIYLINKSKQNQLQFRPNQEQLLNPTRQITDYIANADSQNTPNLQIHHTPKPNDRSIFQKEKPIIINDQVDQVDQVDQEKEQEDLKTFKPHWSKPDQKSEIKSPEQKSPEQKSPEQKLPEQKLPTLASLHDHNRPTNQPQEDDWFERDRNTSTSQIIHKLANPQNVSKKPKTQEFEYKSVPITFQAASPNTQEMKQLVAIKKPEHYFAILEVVYGPMKDAIFFITQRETSIGRAVDATCPLPPSGKNADLAISRYHFSLFKYPNRWHLRCTSSQSMYVNQEQIVKGDEIELEDHDRIRVGQTIFLFKIHKS